MQAWPNGVASKPKSSTCIYLWLCLARALDLKKNGPKNGQHPMFCIVQSRKNRIWLLLCFIIKDETNQEAYWFSNVHVLVHLDSQLLFQTWSSCHKLPHLTMSAHVQCCSWGSSSKPAHMQDLKRWVLTDTSNVISTWKYQNAIAHCRNVRGLGRVSEI